MSILNPKFVQPTFLDFRERLRWLHVNGYPGPISFCTSFPQYFPHVFKNQDGYWAYIVYNDKLRLLPTIVCLTGDPVCPPERLQNFVEQAVRKLKLVGHIVALQVHRNTALALEATGACYFVSHQFGVETQIRLPYLLTDQIGTKVRQAVKEGLSVEELVWSDDKDKLTGETVYIQITEQMQGVKKDRAVNILGNLTSHTESLKAYTRRYTEIDYDRLISVVDTILHNDNNQPSLEEFRRKIVRQKEGRLPKGVTIFTEYPAEGSGLTAFGYYQPTGHGFKEHRFQIVQHKGIKIYTILKGEKRCVTRQDMAEMEDVSKHWLAAKLNPKEMGPPFLKPFSLEIEPGRRLFVARNNSQRIVAFVDFDPVNWINHDGTIDKSRTGYYSNMIRNTYEKDDQGNELHRNVRFLILGAAAQRFASEGHSLINLGLSPFAKISRNNRTSCRGVIYKGLSLIDIVLSIIASNKFANATTFSYNNVVKTKQQNWNNRGEISTYLVIEGNTLRQFYGLFVTFLAGGAIGKHVMRNGLNLLIGRLKNGFN